MSHIARDSTLAGGTTIEMPIREWPLRDGLEFDTTDAPNMITLRKVDQGIYVGGTGGGDCRLARTRIARSSDRR